MFHSNFLIIMKKYILLLAAAGLMSSCYDLEQYPHDQLNAGTFWKTENHAHQGMVAIYATLLNENGFGAYYNNDALGEIAMDYNNWQMPTLIKGTYTDRTGIIQGRWQTCYEGVFRSNLLLQNIDGVDISEELKDRYKGEAKFMRALYYFYLLDFYGGVPLYDENTVVSESFMEMKNPRSSVEDTRNFIMSDLDEAVNVLPVKWESGEYGRATRGAAVALRGKVKLFAQDYAGAAADFEEIVNDPAGRGYGYRLNDSYPDLFTLAADQCEEMIFSIQCINGTNNNYGLPYPLRLGTRATFAGCWNNCMPTDLLADMYEYQDGRPFSWDEIFPGISSDRNLQKQIFGAKLSDDKKSVEHYPNALEKIRLAYESRDPRLEQSLITPYSYYNGCNGRIPKTMQYVLAAGVNEANGFIRDNLGHFNYYWRKFVPDGDMDGILEDRSYSPVDFPLIRYADVLLMLAECYNELGKQEEAVALINQVRQRPSTHMPALNSGPQWLEARTKEAVFERIVHERAVELACEGHRFGDLKRWKLAEQKLNYEYDDILGNVRFTREFQQRDYLWPIPAVEFERNENLGEQNPGW